MGQTWFYEFSLHCFVKGERWKIAWVLSWTGCSSSSRSTSCELVEEESNSPIATTALSFCVFKLLIKIEKYDKNIPHGNVRIKILFCSESLWLLSSRTSCAQELITTVRRNSCGLHLRPSMCNNCTVDKICFAFLKENIKIVKSNVDHTTVFPYIVR